MRNFALTETGEQKAPYQMVQGRREVVVKNAVIYARYSSDKQDEASIDAQVRACREYAASKGYAVLEVYADEAVSGKGSKTASRKAYQKLLRDVNKGRFDTILIHKYDRVAITSWGSMSTWRRS